MVSKIYDLFRSVHFDDEIFESCRENEEKDSREIKRSLRVSQATHGTYVCAVAVARDDDDLIENRLLTIPVMGEPLSKECYDTIRDVFVVEGVDWMEIGIIPVNYVLHFGEHQGSWDIDIPLPPSVIKRYLDKDQKTLLNRWKSRWSRSDYRIDFLQSISVY